MNGNLSNKLLAVLPTALRSSLAARLKAVSLPMRTVLYEPDETPQYAHFITSGIASVVTAMADGTTAEVGIFGNEGLVECFHLLGTARIPSRCLIQIEATALRMPFRDLQRLFLEVPELRDAVLQCVQSQSAILGQLAACNRLHEAEQRLARWMLMVRDRVESDNYFITQEFLSNMLGARRTTVTAAASALQRKGIIKYSRGRIRIVDVTALKAAACECYPTVHSLYLSFYSPRQHGRALNLNGDGELARHG